MKLATYNVNGINGRLPRRRYRPQPGSAARESSGECHESSKRRFEPNHALLMPARGDEIHPAIAIHVRGLNVCRAPLMVGEQMFCPLLFRIARCLPPGEPSVAG